MKIITIKIPTSFAEIKSCWKERISKRYNHNCKVLADFAKEVNQEIKSNYWSNDISEYARNALADGYSGKINDIYKEYKSKLK